MFDLDSLERDGDAPPPFTVTLAGEAFTLADPQTLEWRQLDRLGTGPAQADLEVLLGEQFKAFAAHPLPGWKVARLLDAWRDHFGLGESAASPTSL